MCRCHYYSDIILHCPCFESYEKWWSAVMRPCLLKVWADLPYITLLPSQPFLFFSFVFPTLTVKCHWISLSKIITKNNIHWFYLVFEKGLSYLHKSFFLSIFIYRTLKLDIKHISVKRIGSSNLMLDRMIN